MTSGPVCCPAGLREPLDRDSAGRLAAVVKAVADPARLQLLSLIDNGGEACVCDLQGALGLSQPTVSYHLKKLADAGLVEREQRGTWAWFRVNPDRMAELSAVFARTAG